MRTALFSYVTKNLGDDLQSLAAALFLGPPDCYVDRDQLDRVRLHEPHRLLMNSWFAIKRFRAVPTKTIKPLFYGFCVGRTHLLNSSWLPYLRLHQPIGCRDRQTVAWLEANGVEAHMTGCITMQMGRRLAAVPESDRVGTYMVDVAPNIEHVIPDRLRHDAFRLTNATDAELVDQRSRFLRIAQNCDVLRRAKLVITSRLHTLLPCVGFGTPVICLVNTHRTPHRNWRFDGYEHLISQHADGMLVGAEPPWNGMTPRPLPADIDIDFLQGTNGHSARIYNTLTQAVEDLIPPDTAIDKHPRSRVTAVRYYVAKMFSSQP